MLLNGSPLNSAPLNGLYSGAAGSDPKPVVPGNAFRWALRVLVGGVDFTARLTGQVEVDRERGAAGLATFTLQMLPGSILPMDWVGRTVSIDYITNALGVTTQKRRYTGRIVTTEWDSIGRLLLCHCGDQLQQRIEKLTVAQIDALVPAYWSIDVFSEAEGRSRWDYLSERLSTVQSSLDSSAGGELRLTTWYAGSVDFTFGAGTSIYDSVSVGYADLTSLTNTVEIEASYRFSRLHQRNETFTWRHPDTSGLGGTQGFCQWRQSSSELPDVAMMKDSASSAGLNIIKSPIYIKTPATGANICGNGVPWINNYPDLLLGVTFTGGRRWAQAVTEKYVLTVVAEASVEQAGEVIARDSLSIDYTTDRGNAWESAPFGLEVPSAVDGRSGHVDERDESQRQAALRCLLNQAKTTVVLAHSATAVSWSVPTSMVLDVDLIHTLRLDDQGVLAQARCSRVADTFDLASGSAVTTLTVKVMRCGGADQDALSAPAFSTAAQEADIAVPALGTQLGGKPSSPVYNDSLDGFSGNYDNADPTLPVFDRRLQITASEIAATERDEKVVDIAARYRLTIPNDPLEL
ncbi:hypothetical protein [Pseudomonas huanghezhanensis]|uniref:hypothetical protein n=1 Tax=Pseudomonas huanghezhanensis TaxID=3002903 RepID=UPI0022863E67|nr:hypothetical protein [Pseudomonas sp. BSw22131]